LICILVSTLYVHGCCYCKVHSCLVVALEETGRLPLNPFADADRPLTPSPLLPRSMFTCTQMHCTHHTCTVIQRKWCTTQAAVVSSSTLQRLHCLVHLKQHRHRAAAAVSANAVQHITHIATLHKRAHTTQCCWLRLVVPSATCVSLIYATFRVPPASLVAALSGSLARATLRSDSNMLRAHVFNLLALHCPLLYACAHSYGRFSRSCCACC
jgi:hypothetical protein